MITRRTTRMIGAAALTALTALSITLTIALLTLGGAQADGHADDEAVATTISVTGAASRSLTTDQTTIDFTVSALADSAQVSVQRAELALAAITTRLGWMGGVDADMIYTRNVSLREEFDWTENGRVSRGFRYSHLLTLRVEGTGAAGEVIDAIVSAGEGAVEINNVSFSTSNRAAVEREVLLAAIRDARATADAIAAELGKMVIDTLEISIANPLSPIEAEEETEAAADAAESFTVAPQIRGGQESVNVTVRATFSAR